MVETENVAVYLENVNGILEVEVDMLHTVNEVEVCEVEFVIDEVEDD